MDISVVIPTYNRSARLAQTLARLAGQEFAGAWEVVVVNNRCTDDTDEVVARQPFPAPLRLAHEREVPGPAAARNAGAAAAAGRYLVFMDDDILAPPDFLQRHFDDLEANPGCWFVGQVVNLPEQEATAFGRYRKWLHPFVPPEAGLSESEGLTGQTFSAPREDFERLGGFDESFFTASGEDRELAMRARASGIRILFDPGIVVVQDDWAGSSIRDYCLRQRLYTQTEPLFWRKYGDEYQRIRLVRENLPPDRRRDPARLRVWKRVKSVLGSRAGQAALVGACGAFERFLPWSPVLWRLYRLAIAGAIYAGFQEGLSRERERGSDAAPGEKLPAG
ncbi:MAG TPA: glycosyltransferase [Pyrinomonadaceae bacterium]|nr:glycosyltransferase [Pyrinomonadaceae bacterium]